MRRVRRTWPLVVGALAILLASGCSLPGQANTPDLAASQVFRFGLVTEGFYAPGSSSLVPGIATLDPDTATDTGSQTVTDLLYDPLVTLDPQMRVEDWGADRVDVSADGLTYTFHLRAGQEFANGTPVTAADYAFSLNRALNPCENSPLGYYLFAIKDAQKFSNENCIGDSTHGFVISLQVDQQGPLLTTLIGDSITAPDPTTLVVTLAQPVVTFLVLLTASVDAALNPAVIGTVPRNEAWLDSLSDGKETSGMYTITSWDHPHGKLILKLNPHWWGLSVGKKPYLDEIDITLLVQTSDGLSAYQADQLDALADPFSDPTAPDRGTEQTLRGFHRVPAFMDYAYVMNWTQAPFDNQDAREALCLAVNRDALNQQLYGGQFLPTWHIVPQGMPGYNASLTGPDGVSSTQGDPTAARAHWQAYLHSLHGAKPPVMSFSNEADTDPKLGPALAQQWQAVLGIVVGPSQVPISDYNILAPLHFPLTSFEWSADYPDPQDVLSLLLTAGSYFNPGGVSVPEADKLALQADTTSDPALRYALYNDAEQLYVDAVAWCPLFQETNVYLQRSQVHGWMLDGCGLTPDDAWLATYIARS